jgi:hypothetical protein
VWSLPGANSCSQFSEDDKGECGRKSLFEVWREGQTRVYDAMILTWSHSHTHTWQVVAPLPKAARALKLAAVDDGRRGARWEEDEDDGDDGEWVIKGAPKESKGSEPPSSSSSSAAKSVSSIQKGNSVSGASAGKGKGKKAEVVSIVNGGGRQWEAEGEGGAVCWGGIELEGPEEGGLGGGGASGDGKKSVSSSTVSAPDRAATAAKPSVQQPHKKPASTPVEKPASPPVEKLASPTEVKSEKLESPAEVSEKSASPIEETSASPTEEKSASPTEEKSASPTEEKSASPIGEKSAYPSTSVVDVDAPIGVRGTESNEGAHEVQDGAQQSEVAEEARENSERAEEARENSKGAEEALEEVQGKNGEDSDVDSSKIGRLGQQPRARGRRGGKARKRSASKSFDPHRQNLGGDDDSGCSTGGNNSATPDPSPQVIHNTPCPRPLTLNPQR